MSDYVFSVGKRGLKRLEILNSICDDYASQGIDQLPLEGKRILDFGCGPGLLSARLAKRNDMNIVVGIDSSSEQIDLARILYSSKNFKNLSFYHCDINNIGNLGLKFDLIICKYVLMHIPSAPLVLSSLRNYLAPKGMIYIEELYSYDRMYCLPQATEFVEWKKLCCSTADIQQSDIYIGKKIKSILTSLGFHVVYEKILTPIFSKKDHFLYPWLSLMELGPALIKMGSISKDYFTELSEALKKFSEDKNRFVQFADHVQFIGVLN